MKKITNKDVILTDNRFLVLGLAPEDNPDGLVVSSPVEGTLHSLKDLGKVMDRFTVAEENGITGITSARFLFDEEKAVDVLKENPSLGAYLLSQVPSEGSLLWNGANVNSRLSGGGTIGVRVRQGEYEGDNLFGEFLTRVAARYHEYLLSNDIEPSPAREGRVIADMPHKSPVFTGKKEEDYFMKYSKEVLRDFSRTDERSEVSQREADREKFIHVDNYRAEWWRSNVAKNGTTGHADRDTDPDVAFQKFECPFGTSYPAPIIVGSSAEQSYLFEMALLGRLDWGVLADDLVERGLIRTLSEKDRESFIEDNSRQFVWMREQICTNPDLADTLIVAQSLVPSDASMGSSVYDAERAPSPAHILSRYIDNPHLLYASAEPFTVQALRHAGESEFDKVSVASGVPSVCAVVFGSDTIGGRVPGGKAIGKYENVKTFDQKGRVVWKREKKYEIPLKSEEERREDSVNIFARLDELFSGVSPDTTIYLVTGNSSLSSDSLGVGLPRVVMDYVRSKNGDENRNAGVIAKYDFVRKTMVAEIRDEKGKRKEVPMKDVRARFVCVPLEHFADAFPSLVRPGVSTGFHVDYNDRDVPVVFDAEKAGLAADMAVGFLDRNDSVKRNVTVLSSEVLNGGAVPCFQVIDMQPSSALSVAYLREQASEALSRLTGKAIDFEPVLVNANVRDWTGSTVLCYPSADKGMTVLSRFADSPVTVEGIPFRDVLSLSVAFMSSELFPGDRARLRAVQAAEGNAAALGRIYGELFGDGRLDSEVKERQVRRAVRELSAVSPAFAEALLSVSESPVVTGAFGQELDLFAGENLSGRNFFGLILGAEADYARNVREDRIREEVASQRELVQESQQKRSVIVRSTPDGEKIMSGIPRDIDGLGQEAWIIGSARPISLMLPNNGFSYMDWDDKRGELYFCRERAKRNFIDLGEGVHAPNNYLYMYATDLAAELGKRRINGMPDSRDMKGVTREGPDGEKFLCTVGIPVMKNIQHLELGNPDGLPSSYYRDKDLKDFLLGVYAADSSSRILSEKHGLIRTLQSRLSKDNQVYYPLGNEFKPQIYNGVKKGFVDNRHAAPVLLDAVDWYIRTLNEGRFFPHNVFVLPKESYEDSEKGLSEFRTDFRRLLDMASFYAVSKDVKVRFPYDAEGHLMFGDGVPRSCVEMAERMVDSFLHVVKPGPAEGEKLPELRVVPFGEPEANGEDMKIVSNVFEPIRANDLARAFGPFDFSELSVKNNAPAHEMTFRMEDGTYVRIYDQRLVSKGTKEITNYDEAGQYPYGIKISSQDEGKLEEFLMSLRGYIDRARETKTEIRLVSGTDSEVDGFSLEGFVSLFGQGDMSSQKDIDNFFRTFEGDITLKVSEIDKKKGEKQKVGKTLSAEQCLVLVKSLLDSGEPVRIDKDDHSFSFESSFTPKKVPEELMILLSSESYIPTRRIEVSLSVVPSEEIDMIGFVNLLESNTENRFVSDKHDVGQELNIYNIGSRFDGTNDQTPYYGREDAKDGFAGYAMIKYTLPDGKESVWHRIMNLDLAKQVVVALTNRKYSFDGVEPYTARQLDLFCTAEAVKMAGEDFLYSKPLHPKQSAADDKVVYLENGSYDITGPQKEHQKEEGKKSAAIVNSPAVEEKVSPESTVKEVVLEPKKLEPEDCPKLIHVDRSSEPGTGYIRENCEAKGVDFTFVFAGPYKDERMLAAAEASEGSLVEFDVNKLSSENVTTFIEHLKEQLPEDCFAGVPFSVNVVCEDGYSSYGRSAFSTQKDADVFFASFFMALKEEGAVIDVVRCGGLPGFEEAAVCGAVTNGIKAEVHTSADCSSRHIFTGKEASGTAESREKVLRNKLMLKDYAAIMKAVSGKKNVKSTR